MGGHRPKALASFIVLAACGASNGESTARIEANASVAATEASAEPQAPSGPKTIAPGQWEVTARATGMELTGVPAAAAQMMRDAARTSPPTVTRKCVTSEEAARPGSNLLTGTPGDDCRFDRLSMAAGSMSGTVQCRHPTGQLRADFQGTYTATSFTSENVSTVKMEDGHGMVMRTTTTGRRLGDCGAAAKR